MQTVSKKKQWKDLQGVSHSKIKRRPPPAPRRTYAARFYYEIRIKWYHKIDFCYHKINLILWYKKSILWYQKTILWYQKIDFVMSQNVMSYITYSIFFFFFLISQNRFLAIKHSGCFCDSKKKIEFVISQNQGDFFDQTNRFYDI